MAVIRLIKDGLRNVVANLGTSRDKMSHSAYALSILDHATLDQAYRSSWLPRKIVDIPAWDACRAWRCWMGDADQIEKVEKLEKQLGVKLKVLQAQVAARLWGGSALVIGTGDPNPEEPLNVESVKVGGLQYLTVLPKLNVNPVSGDVDTDVKSQYFGKPILWEIQTGNGKAFRVHISRLVIFQGATVPIGNISAAATEWGDSVLQAVYNACLQADSTTANIASLVFEANVDVIKIPGLSENLASGKVFEEQLLARFTLANQMKGINGTLILDSQEEYDRKATAFSNLPEIMDRFYQNVSGAADIPMTRLFGRSAAGMNATGESDMRNYYDHISSVQQLVIEPAMDALTECLIRSALGSKPEEFHFNWNPLWQPTVEQKATIGKTIADTIKTVKDAGLYATEAVAEAAANSLVEAGVLPGLEEAIDKFGTITEENEAKEAEMRELEAEMAASAEAAGGAIPPRGNNVVPLRRGAVKDAAPRSLYVSRKVLNGAAIASWARSQGFKDVYEASEMHVTLVYSKTPVDWMKVPESWQSEIKIAAGGPRLVERFGKWSVLMIKVRELEWRHREIIEAGSEHGFPEYQPHISFSKSEDYPDLSSVTPYQGEIVLGPELFEEIEED